MTRRRAARQPERREAVLSIRMTHEQRAEIARRSHNAGMTDSGYASLLLLKRKPKIVVPEYRQIDPTLFNELRRIGNNLNQIAHAANAGLPPDHRMTAKALHDLITAFLQDDLLAQRMEYEAKSANKSRPANDRQTEAGARSRFEAAAGT